MKKTHLALAGLAVAFLVGGVETSSAVVKKPIYRPLKVTRKATAPVAAAAVGAGVGATVGAALAAPAYAVGGVGGPVGVAGDIAGGTIAGATNLAFAPLAAIGGGPVGISPVAAPPLPIAARYERTGKVAGTYDEGYAQDVPVDSSGPIYKLNYKEDGERPITPFSLLAFPISGLASAATAPVRALTP